jgi:hypothetical protein
VKIDKMSENELRLALKESRSVVGDLMKSHEELLAGVPNIVCDFMLLNTCRINGDLFLSTYQ